jgi:NADPH-dependent 2,4-dienoyl-CoA reductase/sulfur reductase-like enzyme
LSKKLWNGKSFNRIWSKTEELGVDLRLGRTALALDPVRKRVIDHHGTSYGYGKLLLATGVAPRILAPGHHDGIIYFRTVKDYQLLRELVDPGQHRRVAVIGGGFIGSEIAAALATNGIRVTLIFPGEGIGDRIFPRDLSLALNDIYRQQGINVLSGESVTDIQRQADVWIVRTRSADGWERVTKVEGVVAGVGTRPATELAQSGGIETGNGIFVDPYLRTNAPDIFAAGDIANVWMPALGERRRVEHEDNATTMGRFAGRAMAGEPELYHHLPFFYSDLFDLGYEAVGDIDARLDTVSHWIERHRKGIVYYLRDGLVRGVLLWNAWGLVDTARALIGQPLPGELDLTRESLLVSD